MNKILIILALLVSFATPALATHFNSIEATVDCDGFEVVANIQLSTGVRFNTMQYVVDVIDSDDVVVTSITAEAPMECHVGVCDFVFTDTFDQPLEGGPYTVTGTFTVIDAWGTPSETFETSVTCGDPQEPLWCPRTPNYWKRHCNEWPLATLTVGGVEYSKAQAMCILRKRPRRDITIRVARHTIAAMLNVAKGAGDAADFAIADGNAYLMEHPLCSKPRGAAKRAGRVIKAQLAAWNRTRCGSCKSAEPEDKSMQEEEMNWGSVKSMYR